MDVDLTTGWTALWAALSGAIPTLAVILGIAGSGIAAWGIAKYVMDKRKGSADPKKLGWMLALAALVIAPQVLFPVFLKIASLVVSFVVRIFKNF
jgi:hypothetical protein